MSCPVCPVADSDSEPGLTAIAVNGSDAPPVVTVKVAVAVTTVPSELVARAVIVVVPWLRPVASPAALIFATCTLLELQLTEPVTSSVDPVEVVPIAMNWLVWPGDATDWEPGMMASEARTLDPEPPLLPPVTVTAIALLVISPPKPLVLAVIVAVPAATPVTTPAELTVATAGTLEAQVAVLVMFSLLEGWLPWPMVPIAVSWAVAPAPRLTAVGLT